MNFEELQEMVIDWADDKDLLYPKNSEKQFMKFIEEVFEFNVEMEKCLSGDYSLETWNEEKLFHDGIGRDDNIEYPNGYMKLEMGDILVTLIILCKQLDIDLIECLSLAYKKISKRKGKTINGTFVKAEDL